MKKLITEIFCIVILSIILGFVYNFFSSKPMPLIRVETQIPVVSDSLLMVQDKKVDSTNSNSVNIKKPDLDSSQKTLAMNSKTDSNIFNKSNINKKSKKDILQEIEKNKQLSKPKLLTVTYQQVVKHLYDKNFVFVDARKHDSFLSGKIGNAINAFPLDDENKDLYFRTLTSLPYDKIIIVYCDGGECELSHHVCDDLFSFGYKNVFIYSKGWEEWSKKKGLNK